MKKILFSLALLLGIVGFCIWNTWHVDQLCQDSAALLEQAGARCALGDYEEALELTYASKHNWDHHEGFFGMALRHTESDDIGILFPPLIESCRQRDGDEFAKRNMELIATLRHLSRMEIPYYFNIL
jgi:hypothetical protein